MKWQKVCSSQIAEIGYDEDAQVLGVRFPLKSGGVSEYHYDNVPPRVHRALVEDKSIGSYFGKNIKGNPAYPFTKIENQPDPTQPIPLKRDGTTSSANPTPTGTEPDSPSPGSALVLIDTMADDLLFTPGKITNEQLDQMRSDWLAEAKKYDISTEKARTELKRFARPLQKLRTGIEARAKELTGATKRKIATIDAEKRRLIMVVGGIEDEVLAPLTAWENKETERVQKHNDALKAIKEVPLYGTMESVVELQQHLGWLAEQRNRDWQEFDTLAQRTIDEEIERTYALLQRAVEREAQAAELAELRRQQAEHAEVAKADAERQAAAEVARLEREKDAAVEREQAAVRLAQQAEAQAARDQEIAVERERQRAAVEAKRLQDEADARARNQVHREKVNGEVIHALVNLCSLTEANALVVLGTIQEQLIPHVTITY